MIGVRGRLEPALLPAAQAHPATQVADAITTGHKAPGGQFRLQTPVTAGLTAAPVSGPDGHLQPFVFLCTGRWPANPQRLPRAISSWRSSDHSGPYAQYTVAQQFWERPFR